MTHPALPYNRAKDQTQAYWRRVQQVLNAKNRAGLTVDGLLGSKTCEAVEKFQRAKGEAADGKLGSDTLKAMDDPDLRLQSLTEEGERHPIEDITEAYPCRPIYIDVSQHQDDIEWHLVRASGIDAVIIKATEGRTHQDPRFREYYKGACDAGLMAGTYHYAHLAWDGKETDPTTQVDNWIDELTAVNASETFGSWLDLETNRVKMLIDLVGERRTVDWILRFLADFKLKTGRGLGLYLAHWTISNLGDEADRLLEAAGRYWWARYPRMPFPLYDRSEPSKHVEGWPWFGWQFGDRGRVPGIGGRVDLNLYNGPSFQEVHSAPRR